jgi:hypothetical protein
VKLADGSPDEVLIDKINNTVRDTIVAASCARVRCRTFRTKSNKIVELLRDGAGAA